MVMTTPTVGVVAIVACPSRHMAPQSAGSARYHRTLMSCSPGRLFRYDNLTVTIQHDSEGDGYFRTLAARGSPYMTFEFAKATPRIKSNGNILEVRRRGDKFGP